MMICKKVNRITAMFNNRCRFARVMDGHGYVIRFKDLSEIGKAFYVLDHHWFGF